jgi:ribosomal protein S14
MKALAPKPPVQPKLRCRHRNRCFRCGRSARLFTKIIQVVPHLFPQVALAGEVPGVIKASW